MNTRIKPGSLVKICLSSQLSHNFQIHDAHARPGVDPPCYQVRHGQIGMYVKHVELESIEGTFGYNDEYSEFVNHYEVVLVDEILIEIKDTCLEPI